VFDPKILTSGFAEASAVALALAWSAALAALMRSRAILTFCGSRVS
jgi:hypothetical protein